MICQGFFIYKSSLIFSVKNLRFFQLSLFEELFNDSTIRNWKKIIYQVIEVITETWSLLSMNERSTTHAANAMIGEFNAVKTHDDSENLDLVSSNTARRELFFIRGSSSEEK